MPSPGVLGNADATRLVKSVPGEARSEKRIDCLARQLHFAPDPRVDVALSVALEVDEVAREEVKEEALLVGGKLLNKSKSKVSNGRRNGKSGKDVGSRQQEPQRKERKEGEEGKARGEGSGEGTERKGRNGGRR